MKVAGLGFLVQMGSESLLKPTVSSVVNRTELDIRSECLRVSSKIHPMPKRGLQRALAEQNQAEACEAQSSPA